MPDTKLNDIEKAVLAELQSEANDLLQKQVNGALRLMLKIRGLKGNWKLENDEFVEQK